MAAHGPDAIRMIQERVAEITGALTQADPTLRQVGPPSGDGVFLVGADPLALAMASIDEQSRWAGRAKGLPARIAIAVGQAEWSGPLDDPNSTTYGLVVNICSRLKDVCRPAGVVLSDAAHAFVIERPDVERRFRMGRATLKGIPGGPQSYWFWEPQVVSDSALSGMGAPMDDDRIARLEARVARLEIDMGRIEGIVERVEGLVDKFQDRLAKVFESLRPLRIVSFGLAISVAAMVILVVGALIGQRILK